MLRNRNSAPEFTGVDPEHVNASLRRSHQDVVLAWMDVETGYLALVNDELGQRCFA
jgi:hypothetical protein